MNHFWLRTLFRKYESLSDHVDFRAVGLETLRRGGSGAARRIAARIDARGSAINSRFRLYRRIAAAVQIGNAACVLEAHSRGLKAVSWFVTTPLLTHFNSLTVYNYSILTLFKILELSLEKLSKKWLNLKKIFINILF